MTEKLDQLYDKYVEKREAAWAVYDSLVSQRKGSKTELADSDQYQNAVLNESRAWGAYLDARRIADA